MRDTGEPLSQGQLDRRADEARALRDAIFGVALFTGVVLVNGVLAILFITLMQALGLWMPTAAEPAPLDEVRSSLQEFVRRPSIPVG